MNPETQQDYRWLVSDHAAELLADSQTAIEDRINILTIVKRLRKDISPSRAALVTEMAQLRIKATRKFVQARNMFFSRKGYEQSTGENIAHYKSLAFDNLPRVADICCGIGGDLLGLGSRNGNGDTVGFDIDFLCSLFAEKNIDANMLLNTHVEQKSFANVDLESFDAIHIDPDRRQSVRTVQGNLFAPGFEEIQQAIARVDNWAIKVAPATPPPDWLPPSSTLEWIGDPRECKQQVIWTGDLAKLAGGRTATCIGNDGKIEHFSNDPDEPAPTVVDSREIQEYLYEPHPCVMAARLVDVLAAEFGLGRLTPGVAYLNADEAKRVPMTKVYEIEEILPFSLRHVGTRLRHLDVGQLDIKIRGIQKNDADQFEKLKLIGDQSAILVLTRHQRQRIALLVRRLDKESLE